jgi:nucleoside-diphosphate kinase
MYQETLIILKPDALERNLTGNIIHRYEEAGLRIIDINYVKHVDEDLVTKHYPQSMAMSIGLKAMKSLEVVTNPEAHGKKVLRQLHEYITRGPVLAIKMGGEQAIQRARTITGFTDPSTAGKGTIRGDYGIDSIAKSEVENRACENLVHASGNPEEANHELSLWFPENLDSI